MNELDELRVKIAKLKGWKFAYVHPSHKGRLYTYTPEEINELGWPQEDDEAEGHEADIQWQGRPDWPRDIAAAWELMNEMNDSGDGLVNMIYAIHDNGPKPKWLCEFRMFSRWILGLGKDPLSGRDDYILGYAHTAPEAICRAYLAWKEAKNG